MPSIPSTFRKNGQQYQDGNNNNNKSDEGKKAPEIPFINLERDNYIQDIARRKLLFSTLKAEQETEKFVKTLKTVSKPAPKKKKLRRHKTSFRIIKNNKNIQVI